MEAGERGSGRTTAETSSGVRPGANGNGNTAGPGVDTHRKLIGL